MLDHSDGRCHRVDGDREGDGDLGLSFGFCRCKLRIQASDFCFVKLAEPLVPLSGRTLSSLRARLAFSLPPDPALALSACILFTLAGCRGLLPAHGGGAPPSRALDARTACHLLGL